MSVFNMSPYSKASTLKMAAAKADRFVQLADRLGLEMAAAKGQNFVFSPLSLRAALSLTAAGADGATLEEFLALLGADTIGNLNSAAQGLMAAVRKTSDAGPGGRSTRTPSHVSSVNSVWVEKTASLKPSFTETVVYVHEAVIGKVDFKNKAKEEGRRINEWVEGETNGLIKDLIPVHTLHEFTSIILVNALYFKGRWLSVFRDTRDGDFRLLDGTTAVRAPFMSNGADHYIALFDGFRVLRLRYVADRAGRMFSMLILLPDKVDGLSDLVKEAVSGPGFFERHCPTKTVWTGRFAVPRFKISSGFEASTVLKKMGLRAAFDPEAAGFEGMAYPSPEHDFSFFISAVLHKATIEVDEEGTVAAAATAVVGGYGCAMPLQPPVDFVADHPFMFAIMEESSGAVLFLGHVVNPLA